jgi:hypothetical protein
MELVGSATRLRRGYGVPNIEGKAATGSGDMSILPPTDSSSHKVEARLNSPARS